MLRANPREASRYQRIWIDERLNVARVAWLTLKGMAVRAHMPRHAGVYDREDSTMVMMNKTPNIVAPGEIDLSTGTVVNPITGETMRHIARWAPRKPKTPDEPAIDYWRGREQTLSRELYLATELDPTRGLSLFDMVLIWPGWLDEKPYFFKDLRGYFNVAASIIRRALRPYGGTLELVGESRWILGIPEGWAGPAYSFSAYKAIAPLKAAVAAFKLRDHATALPNARKALELSKGSHAAKLIVAACIFQFGQQIDDDEFATNIAEYSLEHEENLRSALKSISILWKREQDRKPAKWAHALDHLHSYEGQLRSYAKTAEGASKFLYGSSHAQSS